MKNALLLVMLLLAFTQCKKEQRKKNVVKVSSLTQKQQEKGGLNIDPADQYPELVSTIALLRAYYYDPTKLKPQEMLFAGLDELQSNVAPVAYTWSKGAPLTVRVDRDKRSFPLKELTNLGEFKILSEKIMSFILPHLLKNGGDMEEREDALYSYINGFLKALDPYSVLIKPRYTDELQMQTKGAYGGVGMVLSIRDYELTVIKPQPGGPALEMGLKKGDKIIQIDNRSTVNMPLMDAVNMIRGHEGTVVNIWAKRKIEAKKGQKKGTWTEPKKYPLKRRRIRIESVVGKMLNKGEGNIAYFRINHFISNTAQDLARRYSELLSKHGAINGIVLDLVDNPGGLLGQAIQVGNAFLDRGVIVSTEGAPGTKKRVRKATKEGTLTTRTPMVVLISSGSASASEIVSGSLKNLDRALLIGETTFGKGTVQQIFTEGPKKPVLKLTIQQYLTAGDVSIQQVGVVPHIRYSPIGLLPGYSLFWPDTPRKTSKRTRSIKSDKVRPPEKPRYELRDYRTKAEKRDYTNSVEDYRADRNLIQFAYDILLHHGHAKASQTLDSLASFMDKRIKKQEETMVADLKKNWKIDWSRGRLSVGKPKLKVKVEFCRVADLSTQRVCQKPLTQVTPGVKSALSIRVENRGDTPQNRLYAIAKSPSYILDGREFLFGAVPPQGYRYWTSDFVVPERTSVAIEPITIELYQRGRGKIATIREHLHISLLPKPQFQIFWALRESKGGDSIAQKGEHFILDMKVKNMGKGASIKPRIALTDHSKGRIFLIEGQTIPPTIAPNNSVYARMVYDVKSTKRPLNVELDVYDRTFRVGVSRKVTLPMGPLIDRRPPTTKTIFLPDKTKIWASALGNAHLVGYGSGPFTATGRFGSFCRINLGHKMVGFAQCHPNTTAKKGEPHLFWLPHIVPPTILLAKQPVPLTRAESITIEGHAFHPESLKDFYILVTNFESEMGKKKVFFAAGKGKKIPFRSTIPLDQGLNHILLVARHDKELRGLHLFSVVREKPEK